MIVCFPDLDSAQNRGGLVEQLAAPEVVLQADYAEPLASSWSEACSYLDSWVLNDDEIALVGWGLGGYVAYEFAQWRAENRALYHPTLLIDPWIPGIATKAAQTSGSSIHSLLPAFSRRTDRFPLQVLLTHARDDHDGKATADLFATRALMVNVANANQPIGTQKVLEHLDGLRSSTFGLP